MLRGDSVVEPACILLSEPAGHTLKRLCRHIAHVCGKLSRRSAIVEHTIRRNVNRLRQLGIASWSRILG